MSVMPDRSDLMWKSAPLARVFLAATAKLEWSEPIIQPYLSANWCDSPDLGLELSSKYLFKVKTNHMVRHVVLGEIGMDDQAWLRGPDKGRRGNVVQLALDAEHLVLEADGGVEVGILRGVD